MRKHAGITLIELMIAVAIVAILAGVAYPSYMQYVLTSHRTEGTSALVRIANLEERYYLDALLTLMIRFITHMLSVEASVLVPLIQQRMNGR